MSLIPFVSSSSNDSLQLLLDVRVMLTCSLSHLRSHLTKKMLSSQFSLFSHSLSTMISVRINPRHSSAIDICLNVSMKTSPTIANQLPSPIASSNTRRPIKTSPSLSPCSKRRYTLQQILDHVENIQQQYEQVIENSERSACFLPWKQMGKLFKTLKPSRTKSNEPAETTDQTDEKCPFLFGGETFQWIALPQYHDHIYENERLYQTER